jgi:hypothetical protein
MSPVDGSELAMGKIPVVLIGLIAIWIILSVVRNGPQRAFGGVFGLLDEPQYGESDRPTRSGKLAERGLDAPAAEPDPDAPPWWSKP